MIEKIQKYRKHLYILFVGLVILTCVAVFYSFVTSPYTGDIEVFMAAANQAKYYPGNVLMRIFQAWELKGIFNRVVIFIVYWFTRLFVKYTDVVAFEACSKAIYGIGTIIALAISSYLLPVKSIVVNGRFCPQSVRSFCPVVAGFNAGTYKVPACVL